MKNLITVSALGELGAGSALLCFPSITVTVLIGASLGTTTALIVARVGGAGLFALGVACWIARNDTKSRAARGIVAAMLFYDIAAAALLAFAGLGLQLYGVALWPAVVFHVGTAIWSVRCLRRNPLGDTMPTNSKRSQTRNGVII